MTLEEALAECPAVAIIRGVTPDEAVAVTDALYAAGFRGVEVPLNSPQPIDSIARIARAFFGRMVVGAGTVLRTGKVREVAAAGGRIIVAPNTSKAIIGQARALGLDPVPGFGSATEAFEALDAGARHLKLFPAVTYGPAHVKQLKAVLPPDATVWAVGGVGAADFRAWWDAGARAFGLGSELYKPGLKPEEVHERAKSAVEALRGFA